MIRHIFLLMTACMLAACGSSTDNNGRGSITSDTSSFGVVPIGKDGQGVPGPTTGGRVGQIYNVTIPSPLGSGETIAATVFEPVTMVAGEKYPLVLYASGFGGVRDTSFASTDPQAVAFAQLVDLRKLSNAGYGILTFDHRGHGESGGKIRVMDPDFEGKNLIRLVDWAEANLDWLAYGMSVDGSDANNLKLGAVGASYGGGYQNLLLTVDPKKRLDAIVPQLTWNDLRYSLASNGVIKDAWVNTLAAGKEPVFDEFLNVQLAKIFVDNKTNPDILDLLRYHGLGYFCDEDVVATNGGPGTQPELAGVKPHKINALLVQSSRDTLFNLNEAVKSYECLSGLGGDVRLYTVQIGHNTLGHLSTFGLTTAPQDPGQTGPEALSATCANEVIADTTIKFFDEHLKGMAGASASNQPICWDLAPGDSISVPSITRGGTNYPLVPGLLDNNVVNVGTDESATKTVSLTQVTGADVVAGIPTYNLTLVDEDDAGNTDAENTIIYVGLGRRIGGVGPWELLENQLTPLRGLGTKQGELAGVLERLNPNDELGLMLFGDNANQYQTTGSKTGTAFAARVRVTGSIDIPLLGNIPPATAP